MSVDRIGRSFPEASVLVIGLRANPRLLLGCPEAPGRALVNLTVELEAAFVPNDLVD